MSYVKLFQSHSYKLSPNTYGESIPREREREGGRERERERERGEGERGRGERGETERGRDTQRDGWGKTKQRAPSHPLKQTNKQQKKETFIYFIKASCFFTLFQDQLSTHSSTHKHTCLPAPEMYTYTPFIRIKTSSSVTNILTANCLDLTDVNCLHVAF